MLLSELIGWINSLSDNETNALLLICLFTSVSCIVSKMNDWGIGD